MSENLLCHPDDEKGCSACCGLFNFTDISKRNLEAFLSEGRARAGELVHGISEEDLKHHETDGVREVSSHICPYQGFVSDDSPGCFIHPLANGGIDQRDRSLFGSKICSSFSCHAHRMFSEEMKNTLITSVHDWYAYTIAIIDPDFFIWLCGVLEEDFSLRPGTEIYSVTMERVLNMHASFLSRVQGPVFFYSLSEYNVGKSGGLKSVPALDFETERKSIYIELAKIFN